MAQTAEGMAQQLIRLHRRHGNFRITREALRVGAETDRLDPHFVKEVFRELRYKGYMAVEFADSHRSIAILKESAAMKFHDLTGYFLPKAPGTI